MTGLCLQQRHDEHGRHDKTQGAAHAMILVDMVLTCHVMLHPPKAHSKYMYVVERMH